MINEYLLKTEGQKPQSRPSQKKFDHADLVECIETHGLDARFALEAGRVFQVRKFSDGAVSLYFMNPNTFYDANRFQLVEGEKEFINPIRGIPTRNPDFKGVAA